MTDKIKVAMFAEPGVMLTPLNCPVCGGCDQHKPDCVLSGKEHVYVSVSQGLTDWPKTLELNNIEITRSEPRFCWERKSADQWIVVIGMDEPPPRRWMYVYPDGWEGLSAEELRARQSAWEMGFLANTALE